MGRHYFADLRADERQVLTDVRWKGMGYFQLDLDGDRRRCAHNFSSSWQNEKFATTKKSMLHEDFHYTNCHYATTLLCQTEEGCILISNKNTFSTCRQASSHQTFTAQMILASPSMQGRQVNGHKAKVTFHKI